MSIRYKLRYLLPLYVMVLLIQVVLMGAAVQYDADTDSPSFKELSSGPSLNALEWSRRTHEGFAKSLETVSIDTPHARVEYNELAAVILQAD